MEWGKCLPSSKYSLNTYGLGGKENLSLATMLFGVPAGFFFWFATREAVLAMGEAWGPRMLGFGMSYVTFPSPRLVLYERDAIQSQDFTLYFTLVLHYFYSVILENIINQTI